MQERVHSDFMGKPQSDSAVENALPPRATTKSSTYFLQALHYPVTDPRRMILRIVNSEDNTATVRVRKSERTLDINQVKLIVKRSTEIETKIVDHLGVIEQFSNDEQKQVDQPCHLCLDLLPLLLPLFTSFNSRFQHNY